MPNNPLVFYKPGLTMDTPIPVSMTAADWAIFISWMTGKDLTSVTHLYDLISTQVTEGIYDQTSLKAAHAEYHEQIERNNPFRYLMGQSMLTPEQFDDETEDDDDD